MAIKKLMSSIKKKKKLWDERIPAELEGGFGTPNRPLQFYRGVTMGHPRRILLFPFNGAVGLFSGTLPNKEEGVMKEWCLLHSFMSSSLIADPSLNERIASYCPEASRTFSVVIMQYLPALIHNRNINIIWLDFHPYYCLLHFFNNLSILNCCYPG